MVKTPRHAAYALLIRCTLALFLAGCGAGEMTVPLSEEPFLYLVLNQNSISQYGEVDVAKQHALLLTAGSPVESPRYRAATRFQMRRASDGAQFDWRPYPNLSLEPGTLSGISMLYANYHLADSASVDGLGRSELQPGTTYEILIQTEGEEIRGRVAIPENFSLSVVEDGGRHHVHWLPVAGAAGYLVSLGDGSTELQTGTTVVVPGTTPGGETIIVQAVDPNLYAYLSEGERGRAGIDKGYGVLGATSTAQLSLSQ